MSHTPGPWTAFPRETADGHDRVVAGPPGPNETRVALTRHFPNARLIAAAPDLLAALEHIATLGDVNADEAPGVARAAIAKAKGSA